MSVELLFEPAAEGRTEQTEGGYRIYPQDEQYHLPRVLIRAVDGPVEVWDVVLAEVGPASGALGQYLRRTYPASAWQPVRVVEAQEVTAAVPVAEDLWIVGSRRSLETVRLTWRVTAGGDQVTDREFPLVLEFATAGDRPAGDAPGVARQREGLVARTPLRRTTTGAKTAKMFAIDFGTSSSTITMVRDEEQQRTTHLPEDQDRRLCRELAGLLELPGPDDPAARDEWRGLVADCVSQVGQQVGQLPPFDHDPVDSVRQLVGHLRADIQGTEQARAQLRDLTLIGLRPGLSTNAELRRWLAGELHRRVDEALFTPALTGLAQVPLQDLGDRYAVSSTAYVLRPGAVTLHQPASDDTTLVSVLPGLKRTLGQPRPLAADLLGLDWDPAPREPATSEFLLLHVYHWLIDRALRFAAGRHQDQLPDAAHVLVTYPTTTPPTQRERLARLLQRDLEVPKPDLTYDEGVAAAMYFVLRELRGSVQEGLERFRSRSRPIDGHHHPTWRRVVLVLDIGGGTTDIALLALDLEDQTPEAVTDPRAGRSYVLTPQVLGSTGHPQLGGDLLTLRVYYWLKALLVDALVETLPADQRRNREGSWPGASRAPDGSYRPLAPYVLANQTLDPVPEAVAVALRALLPTDLESGGRAPAFERLWHEAETAKIALGALAADAESVTVHDTRLDLVLQNTGGAGSALPASRLTAPTLRLSGRDFARLARPVLTKAADLAAELVVVGLRERPDDSLDQVFLSGRSAQMPLVGRLVADALAQALNQRTDAGGWDRSSLVVERTNAKQAASIGACWAQEQRNLRATGTRDDALVGALNEGGSVVLVNVDNMFLSLPCHFFLRQPDGARGQRLLTAGTPCRYSDRQGKLAARSRWYLVPRNLRVHRDLGAGESIEWGDFRYHLITHALRQTGITLPGEPPADLYFQLQVDQDLTPTLFLCRGGSPDFLMHESGVDISRLLPATGGGRAVVIHAEGTPVGRTSARVAGRSVALRLDGPEPWFPHRIQTLHPDADPIAGLVGEVPLPEPEVRSSGVRGWRFEISDGTGGTVHRTELRVPDGPYDRAIRYFASLDQSGCLRVHRGYPRYLTTTRFVDMLSHPGTVFHTSMTRGEPVWKDSWDPFNGRH
ncbi:acetate and sugar kinases/Hsc70/actin family protein [Micromonospora rifamycinica]|uniref:Molecular chaperone n=1 Tax=Micromonospora rifamycinica TaxID=291594 RepID=A0A109IQD0_9ACTN|nr:hypothetical protein [Micromonospora rifamycinica]KWV34649.1 hypothetical protein AWV63_00295 [Micromonospora rifamycinica]SCG67410.1 hypothetical protein GA0070623_3271 [Micromonospora rifamycinica]